mmetsp:Transcript_4299/g.12114  ORF Transcript_4299/g.12114 Transcript_4299/m.12114 type:complete len:367 (-) Transcript_4299:356-1456(-)
MHSSMLPPAVVLVSDPGPDPDDAKGILLAAHFHMAKQVRLLGVICCGGGQSRERARLCRRILQLCYPRLKIPVAVGAQGAHKPHTPAPHEYDVPGFESTTTDGMPSGTALLRKLLAEAEDNSLTVEIQAAFTDVAEAIAADRGLFRRKVCRVCAMGGLRDPQAAEWDADEAFNNELDREAANAVYRFCQSEGVSLTVVGRDAVPQLPMTQMRRIAATTQHPVMHYLSNAQDGGLIALWTRVCRKQLPARCTKEWYFTTFCGATPEEFRALEAEGGPADDVDIKEHLHGHVKPYDPMTVMAVLPPSTTAKWFDWKAGALVGANGTMHHVFQSAELVHGEAITADLISALRHSAEEGQVSDGCAARCM